MTHTVGIGFSGAILLFSASLLVAQQPSDAPRSDTVTRVAADSDAVLGVTSLPREEIPGYAATARFLGSLHRRDNSRAEPATTRNELSLDLVVDETLTPMGRDFFQAFYTAWKAPEGAPTYAIRIGEQPTPGLSTRIVLYLNNERLLQFPLVKTSHDFIEEVAGQAVRYMQQQLRQRLSPDVEGS